MSVFPYHRRYHGDALTGFMALSLEERGAYQTILDLIYDRGGPIEDNERLLAGYMNCSVRKWRMVRDQLLEKGKIRIAGDGRIFNSRAIFEIENATKTQRKLIEAGAKGGRTRVENAKKLNEINGTYQAELEPASSDPQAISESRIHMPDICLSERARAGDISAGNGRQGGRQAGYDLAYQLADMAGMQLTSIEAINRAVAQAQQWLDAGIPADACQRVVARCLERGQSEPTRSLARFDKVIRADYAHGTGTIAPPGPPKPPPVEEQIRFFETQAQRMHAIGDTEAEVEFLNKAEQLKARVA